MLSRWAFRWPTRSADIAIVTVAAIVLTRARTGRRSTLAMLAAGVVLMALSDSAFVYLTARGKYFSGHLIDVGWAAVLRRRFW